MKKNDSRRKLLKSLAAGSGAVAAGTQLPSEWIRPAITTVILPAHAETTETIETTQSDSLPASFSVPGAHQYVVPAGATSITVAMSGGGGGGAAKLDAGKGGDGEHLNTVVNVTPGEVLAIMVGTGGAVYIPSGPGGQGGDGGGLSSVSTAIASGGDRGEGSGSTVG